MTIKTCTIEGCSKIEVAKGMCRKHYMRVWKNGDALNTKIHVALDTAEETFWSRVEKTDYCWNWKAAQCRNNRYGMFYYRSEKPVKAHRYGYIIQNGPIPEGLYVLHHCDNELCIRGEHLYVGTQLDNMRDRWTHGKGVGEMCGVNVNTAKLTEKDVLQIRHDSQDNWDDFRRLAEVYSVTATTIKNVVRRKNWKHI